MNEEAVHHGSTAVASPQPPPETCQQSTQTGQLLLFIPVHSSIENAWLSGNVASATSVTGRAQNANASNS